MGGCCCSARKHHFQGTPVYYYCLPTFEERGSSTPNDGTTASLSAGFLVRLNFEANIPDTFRSPPVPLPYDIVFGGSASTDSESGRETVSMSSFGTSIARDDDIEESDCKAQTKSTPLSPKEAEQAFCFASQICDEEGVQEDDKGCPKPGCR